MTIQFFVNFFAFPDIEFCFMGVRGRSRGLTGDIIDLLLCIDPSYFFTDSYGNSKSILLDYPYKLNTILQNAVEYMFRNQQYGIVNVVSTFYQKSYLNSK